MMQQLKYKDIYTNPISQAQQFLMLYHIVSRQGRSLQCMEGFIPSPASRGRTEGGWGLVSVKATKEEE